MNDLNDYILYWRNGAHEKVRGRDIASAMTRAGYGAGALGALDFFGHGREPSYFWNEDASEWQAIPNP